MRGDEGGFYSALDADSEGEEGKFYVWTLDELREAGGEEAVAAFGATEEGNFEGKNILVRAGEASPELKRRLYEVRVGARLAGARRQAADLVERADDRRAGGGRRGARARRLPRRRARLRRLRPRASCATSDGRLLRTWKDGQAKLNAYLEDHAYLLEALLTLYEATFEPRWFTRGARARRHDDRAVRATTSAAASSRRRPTTSSSSPAARTWRTTRSRPATRAPRTACCAWRR